MDDPHRLATVDDLRRHYRMPGKLVVEKERAELDEATARFISRCRFAVVATFDEDGNADASPRGGPSGFVRVLDAQHIALADLNGNNRLDTLQNVVRTGRAGLLFVMPGKGETVRVNGAAWVTTDPAVLGAFQLPKVPVTAIVVRVESTYVHCAKAFMRGGVWDPAAWAALAETPDGAEILACQFTMDANGVRGALQEGYAADLAADG